MILKKEDEGPWLDSKSYVTLRALDRNLCLYHLI